MTVDDWHEKYLEILREFHYDRVKEIRSARILDSLLEKRFQDKRLENKIRNKIVLVIGAGPSLDSSIQYIRKLRGVTKIAADGATQALLENDIIPDIVVTDLDGHMESLRRTSEYGSIMIVHAHGDNINRLPYAILFGNCIGTTEDRPVGKIRNFGGFTDGDRCVFLADHFGASRIILIGMDFGTRIGRYSKKVVPDVPIKIKKLEKAKSLLGWLSSKSGAELYTTSQPITGFENVGLEDLQQLVRHTFHKR